MSHIPKHEFKQRREQLLAFLRKQKQSAIAVIPAASLQTRSRDTEYPFRQDSDFFYLTGFNEPDAVLILAPDADEPVQLFCQPSDPHAEVWHGRRLGIDRAVEALDVNAAFSIEQFEKLLPELLNGVHSVFYPHDKPQLQQQLNTAADFLRSAPKKGYSAPIAWVDCNPQLANMRLIKSENELKVMRRAAEISVLAHQRAMRSTQPGRYEYQISADIQHEFAMHGALSPAYGIICGGGENACILHYTENSDVLRDGDLLLIDAGAEYQGYAGDITRTFPVNGRFSDTQKALYEVVLAAQEAALATLKPGSSLPKAQDAAAQAITHGLIDLGILKGSFAEHWEATSYRKFFIHGLGHWLGLDVHDVGTYDAAGKKRAFEPGMLLTVEPGIYIPPGMPDVDEKWHGIGIRIEDDCVITADGYENLTAGVPKTVAEIEQWMQNK